MEETNWDRLNPPTHIAEDLYLYIVRNGKQAAILFITVFWSEQKF